MDWLKELFTAQDGVAHAALILALIAVTGMAAGAIRVFGISLGVAGVLFAGLIFGNYHIGINHDVLDFARDFGLILFVYTIGVQVGPGFLASLRRRGLPLNLMAAAIVILGAVIAILIGKFALPHNEFPVAVGLFSGGTTNTPSLAAAQQALQGIPAGANPETAKMPAVGYAIAYPFGVLGIILTMYVLKWIFRISPQQEAETLEKLEGNKAPKINTRSVEVTNPAMDGQPIGAVAGVRDGAVVISRVVRSERAELAQSTTLLSRGDVLLAVGPEDALDGLTETLGGISPIDVKSFPSQIRTRKILITKAKPIGKTAEGLHLEEEFGVRITRVTRADIDLPVHNTVLQFGDSLTVVGDADALKAVSTALGDSKKKRDHPMVIPMFIGIAAGVVLGSIPIALPGFPSPVKLGLAGGPLIAAIVLSRIGRIGPLVWYMPQSANLMVREIGIVLFLACVGLKAGGSFVQSLTHGPGLLWMGYGAILTALPLLIVGLIARGALKLNYAHVCGLLAGSMTDPPALAFAGTIAGSEGPSVAYATVYPLVMLMRVLIAQSLILFFFH